MQATNECEHRITTLTVTDNRSQEHVPKPQLHAGNQLSTMHCASQIYWFCSNWPCQCPYSFCISGTQFFREGQNQDSRVIFGHPCPKREQEWSLIYVERELSESIMNSLS